MSTAVVAEQKVWYLNRWNQLVLGVIAMMAIGAGAKAQVEQAFAAMGTNLLIEVHVHTASEN